MDLQMTCGGEPVKLYPTGLRITEMILTTKDGRSHRLTGDDALRAVHSYLQWFKHCQFDSLDKTYSNMSIEEKCAMTLAHIDEIAKVLKSDKKIEVFDTYGISLWR